MLDLADIFNPIFKTENILDLKSRAQKCMRDSVHRTKTGMGGMKCIKNALRQLPRVDVDVYASM